MSPIVDKSTGGVPTGAQPDAFLLIAPATDDSSSWPALTYTNIYDGIRYRLAPSGDIRLPSEAEPSTFGQIIARYPRHREAKSLAPDGRPCTADTAGLLRRTPIVAGDIQPIGKETDRRWEQGEDISLVQTRLLKYRRRETKQMVYDRALQRQLHQSSIRVMARESGVSPTTIKVARRGDRIRKSTANKLWLAIENLSRRSPQHKARGRSRMFRLSK
jgi:hypothetical protein